MPREYTVDGSHPYLYNWTKSHDSFACAAEPKYTIICHQRWERLKQRLFEEGDPSIVSTLVAIAVCLVIIGALSIYIVKLKRKMRDLEQQNLTDAPMSMVEGAQIQST